jgi:hypothetical protein
MAFSTTGRSLSLPMMIPTFFMVSIPFYHRRQKPAVFSGCRADPQKNKIGSPIPFL